MRTFERIRQYLRWSTFTGLTPRNEYKAPFYQRGYLMPRDLTDYEDELLNLLTQPDQIELSDRRPARQTVSRRSNRSSKSMLDILTSHMKTHQSAKSVTNQKQHLMLSATFLNQQNS